MIRALIPLISTLPLLLQNAADTSGAIEPTTKATAGLARQDGASETEHRWTMAELEAMSAQIQADLERLRGERFLRPVTLRLSNKPDLIAYAKKREAKTDTPDFFEADEQIAKLLGAIAPELDLRAKGYELLETQVAGFYDPDTDSFSLMETLPVALTRITLAHELDHALDDQLFDIDGTLKRLGSDTDAIVAYQAVVEGSGTAAMTQWALANQGSIDFASINASDMKELTSMAGAPMWMWKPMLGVYMAGAGFLQRSDSWLIAQTKPLNNADIRAAFERPPLSTEQILHPAKYWDASQRDDPTRLGFETKELGDGWSVLREDTLGELLVAILCTPPAEREAIDLTQPSAMLAVKFTNEVASGWDGDRVILLGKESQRVLRWVSVWDSERDAGEFFGALLTLRPSLEAAARAIASGSKDCGVELTYGSQPNQVQLTLHAGVRRTDLKRVLRAVELTTSPSPEPTTNQPTSK